MISLCAHKGRGRTHPNTFQRGMYGAMVCATVMGVVDRANRARRGQPKHEDGSRLRDESCESWIQP